MIDRHKIWTIVLMLALAAGWSPAAWAASSTSLQTPAVTSRPAYYGFAKTVTLTNTGNAPALNVKARITLMAPSNAYAHVSLVGFSKKPASKYHDKYGNLIGLFTWGTIKPRQSVSVTLHYQATSLDVAYRLPKTYARYNVKSAIYQKYTNPELEARQVDTGAAAITALDNKLVGDLSNPYQRAQTLFNWVADNIRYNYGLTASGSALKTLHSKVGICSDIADLYVGMLRTDHIPARLIGGYVTNNGTGQGGFHQWVEFYLPKTGWVVTDPTWGRYGYFAALQDDWHIPLYDGIRSDISVHWEHNPAKYPHIAIAYHYHFTTEQSPPVTRHVTLPLVSIKPPVAKHSASAVVKRTLTADWKHVKTFFHQYFLRLKIVLESL